jgi:preprotein translocase subunit SecY
MNVIGKKINQILQDKSLLRRIGFIVGILFISRLLAAIPIPGVDALSLQQFFSSNQFFGVLNVLSGSGLSTLSIVMLGVGPYITASIIMQLLTVMIPRVKALQTEEGERGRLKFAQYARILTIPLALIQGFSLLLVLETARSNWCT